MNIGQKIKALRQENNLTQEDLAEALGVSFQAVSRWENGTTYPDITLLPIIASMFDVTIDYLFDMDTYKINDEINKIKEQDDMLFNQGKIKERELLLENALKKYPNDWDLKGRLMCTYFTFAMDEESFEYEQKTIKIANNILEKCIIDSLRYYAMQTLVIIYRTRKELDKAKKIVDKLPIMIVSNDYLLPDVLTGEERIKATQQIFSNLVEIFNNKLLTTYGREEIGKRDIQLLKYKSFLDIVYENGDYGFQNIRLSDLYMLCAKDKALIKNEEKTIDYLNKSLERLMIFLDMYNNQKTLKHTSFLVDRLEDDPTTWSFSENPNTHLNEFCNKLNDEIFDFIRNTDDFKKILKQLN